MKKHYPFLLLTTFFVVVSLDAVTKQSTNTPPQYNNPRTSESIFISELTTHFYDTTIFSILDSAVGDLNLDPYPDKVLVLKDKYEHIATTSARPALLLIGQPDLTFLLRARNDSIVLCNDCGGIHGDPYVDVVIEKGQVRFEHYGGSGWRWTRNIAFQYEPRKDHWYLKEDGGVSYHAAEPDSIRVLINNEEYYGKMRFENFNNKF